MNNPQKVLQMLSFVFLHHSFLSGETYKTNLSFGSRVTHIPGILSTWEREQGNINLKRYGGVFEAIPFHQTMGPTKKLNHYFGMKDPEQQWTDYIEVGPNAPLKSDDLIHDANNLFYPEHRSLSDQLYFAPRQKVSGVHLIYFHQLCDFSKHLAISLHLPIVAVENSMGIHSPQSGVSQRLRLASDLNPATPYQGKNVDLIDFLEGNVKNNFAPNQQEPLKKMKIVRRALKSQGPSDLTIRVHCLLEYSDDFELDFSGHCMIPFEGRPRGEYLFEPVRGNAGHWGFGCKGEAAVRLFLKNKTTSLHFLASLTYDYILKGVEHRAIGYNRFDKVEIPWGLYRLGGTLGEKKVEPLANILTQEVKVKPDDRLTFLGSCTFQHRNFHVGCGTEVYVQSKESLRLTSFKSGAYNLAAKTYDTSIPFDPIINREIINGFTKGMTSQDLLLETATNEMLLTQTLYAHISWILNFEITELRLGSGTGMLFGHNNRDRGLGNRWIIWTRVGILF